MWKIRRYQILLPFVAFGIYFLTSAPFIGPWDSFDYLQEIVLHKSSSLGFGRPVFIGYNILIWESMRWVFHLQPWQVEIVTMAGILLFGALGVLLFQRFCRQLLPAPACAMATLALAVSPVYALYSGIVMTEIPMLVTLMASALILWDPGARRPMWRDVSGGLLFGLAVGMREQALTMVAAYFWILFSRRRSGRSPFRSVILFSAAATLAFLVPLLLICYMDPSTFIERIRTWFHAVPLGPSGFRSNAEASILYTLSICPGAWLAAAGAGIYSLLRRQARDADSVPNAHRQGRLLYSIPHPVWGVICCLALPVAALWHDADVQMHPRYALVALPASLIVCASLYHRWMPSRKGSTLWAVAQVAAFGAALAVIAPTYKTQCQKMEFAQMVREAVPGDGLLIAGSYSPVFDYYRGIGIRPGWRILWSGWNWDIRAVEEAVSKAWADRVPVYLSENPLGWRQLETEFLELHFLFKNRRKEQIAPKLYLVYPP
jgi:hypothetical protein